MINPFPIIKQPTPLPSFNGGSAGVFAPVAVATGDAPIWELNVAANGRVWFTLRRDPDVFIEPRDTADLLQLLAKSGYQVSGIEW